MGEVIDKRYFIRIKMDIGKHCAVCKRQDFLPFHCDGCDQHFCKDHRTPESHNCEACSEHTSHVQELKPNSLTSLKKCACGSCSTRGSQVDYQCRHCKKEFCVTHRLPQTHSCTDHPMGQKSKPQNEAGKPDSISEFSNQENDEDPDLENPQPQAAQRRRPVRSENNMRCGYMVIPVTVAFLLLVLYLVFS